MKKVIFNQYGSINELQMTEVNTPVIKPNELLIKVKAVAINPLDWKKLEGQLKLFTGSKFPKGIGFDFAGVVEKKGDLVTCFEPGDEVFGALDAMKGEALAEYIVITQQLIYKKPASIPIETASAMVTVGVTELKLFENSGLKPGNELLINGASGGVGMISLQIAIEKGLKVTAVAGGDGLAYIQKWNPNNVFDYKKGKINDDRKAAYDAIFELSGSLSFKKAKPLLKHRSFYVSTLPFPVDIIGSFFNNLWSRKKHKIIMSKPTHKNYRELCKWVNVKGLEVAVAKIFSIDDYKEAYQYVRHGGIVGKVVFSI